MVATIAPQPSIRDIAATLETCSRTTFKTIFPYFFHLLPSILPRVKAYSNFLCQVSSHESVRLLNEIEIREHDATPLLYSLFDVSKNHVRTNDSTKSFPTRRTKQLETLKAIDSQMLDSPSFGRSSSATVSVFQSHDLDETSTSNSHRR